MKQDLVMRVALWLVAVSSAGAHGEAFAGDLLEMFVTGRSRWWCFGQALRRSMPVMEQRLRSLLAGFWYCVGFVLLYPLWQRVNAPSTASLLLRYRGVSSWPGSAVLEIAAGLLPAVEFVWVGIFLYALLRWRSLHVNRITTLLSLNVGVCVLFVGMMMRLDAMRHDLRLLSRADFYYPMAHGRFSILLFFSLWGAVLVLPRERRPSRPRHTRMWLRGRGGLLCFARRLGFDALRGLHLRLLMAGLMMLAMPVAMGAQDAMPRLMAADGKPMEFDVVSVKANHSGATSMSIASPPTSDAMTITNMPVEDLLEWAFGIFLSDEISGVPGWARQERYDVMAKVSDADAAAFRKIADPIQRTPMLQKVLVERFGLQFHYEMKELAVYALVVGKSGSRMMEIEPAVGPNGIKDSGSRQLGRGQIKSMGQPMKPLVNQLTRELGRPVVDRTGLTGYYNYTLRWTPEGGAGMASESAGEALAPSIFTAVQEQLGLKLESAKAPVRVLVIDHIERASVN